MQQYACVTAPSSSEYLPADVHAQNCEQFPQTLSTSQHTKDSLYPQVLLVGTQLAGPRVHAVPVQT